MFTNRLDRVLAAIVGGGLFLLGAGELISRLGEPAPLLFWLPTLWGGAALVLLGSFHVIGTRAVSKMFVIVGGVLGILPTAWTIVMPVLIITLVLRAATSSPDSEVRAT